MTLTQYGNLAINFLAQIIELNIKQFIGDTPYILVRKLLNITEKELTLNNWLSSLKNYLELLIIKKASLRMW